MNHAGARDLAMDAIDLNIQENVMSGVIIVVDDVMIKLPLRRGWRAVNQSFHLIPNEFL
jgi:hypothetical protein